MRLLIMLFALTLALPAAADQSGTPPYKKRATKTSAVAKKQAKPLNSYGTTPSTMEGIEANALDPTGRFAGYPDWARIALSPKIEN